MTGSISMIIKLFSLAFLCVAMGYIVNHVFSYTRLHDKGLPVRHWARGWPLSDKSSPHSGLGNSAQCDKQQRSVLVSYWLSFLPEASFGLRVLSLPASVCLCVCMCGNHVLVRTITHHRFKLGSPNLDQGCKVPWLRHLLFLEAIDLGLQGQILLKMAIFLTSPILEIHNHHMTTKEPWVSRLLGSGVQSTLVKTPVVFGGNWPWPSRSNFT